MKNVQSSQQEETHSQYRNRVGRTSRHQHLMSQKSDRSERREEIKRYSEASERIEKKVQREIEETRQKAPSFRDRQITPPRDDDTAREGAEAPPKPVMPSNRVEGGSSQMTDSRSHDVHDAMEASA